MEKIIEKLASLAEELDSKNLSVHADTVDGVAKTILGVKTAQYVGIQGYWVRNSRCWGNCYRQKRSSNPETPTQEVWAECHEEYTKAIDNDSARKEWDKYAALSEKEMALRMDKAGYKFFLDQSIEYRAIKHPRLNSEWEKHYQEGIKYYQKCIQDIFHGDRLNVDNLS